MNPDRREMTIQPDMTKTRTGRVIPISARLLAVLKVANTDPAGKEFGPELHVFGDVVGTKVNDIKKAWETCVLKAHGHMPAWTRDNALNATKIGLQESMRRLDASRDKPVARNAETEQAPPRHEQAVATAQGLVN